MAYEAMYERTPVGTVEIKELPGRLALETRTDQSYFERDNGLFMRLFRYIEANEIAMTVPVEAEEKPGVMRFFVGGDHGKTPSDSEQVQVVEMPARTVASLGMRGGYNHGNFEKGRTKLLRWLAEQSDWEAEGEPYVVYWHGPFVPRWMKRSEVHIPVRVAESRAEGTQSSTP